VLPTKASSLQDHSSFATGSKDGSAGARDRSAVYYPCLPTLRQRLQLVFLDHRGSPHRGPVDTAEFALDKLIDDVRSPPPARAGPVVVVGHSGHGLLALVRQGHPASVSGVVMIGIGPDLSPASTEAAERSWNESVSPERRAALGESLRRLPDTDLAKLPPAEQFVRGYVRNGPRIWFDPRFDASALFAGVEMNTDMYRYVWGQVFRDIDITRDLAALDCPVFLALGRYDFIVAPPSSWDRLRPHFRDLTVRIFERSGHTPQYEEPELFDAELLRWLDRPR
jgi:proline iminopeptidase